jgi:hypothetical protein
MPEGPDRKGSVRVAFTVTHDEDSVQLMDDGDEIVSWTMAEWEDDPALPLAITNAIKIGYEQGPDAVRALID